MGNTCLFTRIRSRLSLHHEISMVRLVTGFFISRLMAPSYSHNRYLTINFELEGSSSLFGIVRHLN